MATEAELIAAAATLNTQIADLNTQIADGVRSVTIGAETTTYNTTASLIAARDDAVNRLAAIERSLSSTRRSSQTRLYYAGRGY